MLKSTAPATAAAAVAPAGCVHVLQRPGPAGKAVRPPEPLGPVDLATIGQVHTAVAVAVAAGMLCPLRLLHEVVLGPLSSQALRCDIVGAMGTC